MTLLFQDPEQEHVKAEINELDFANIELYKRKGYTLISTDEETVDANDEAETIDDVKETDDTKEADELVDDDEETVDTKDEAETVADDEEKPKPRRRRRTVEK